jgi:hypothetical protein
MLEYIALERIFRTRSGPRDDIWVNPGLSSDVVTEQRIWAAP